jgi:hypothetical protein
MRKVLGIIVEVQTGCDGDKPYPWPAYIANLRDMEHLKDLISNEFNRHEFILRVGTSVIFNRVDRYTMPASTPTRGQRG